MSTIMLDLTDTSGAPLQLLVSEIPIADYIVEHRVTDVKKGSYLDDNAPKVEGIMNWQRDSWKLDE